jgi:hypothetical protein
LTGLAMALLLHRQGKEQGGVCILHFLDEKVAAKQFRSASRSPDCHFSRG